MEQSEEAKISLSFGFSRRKETTQLKKSIVNDHDQEDAEDTVRDFVSSLEGKEVRSTKPAFEKKKKDFIIPLIQQNRWRTKDDDLDKVKCGNNDLEILAAEEILKDSVKQNDEWAQNHTTKDSGRSIPLLMQNKIPDGYETDEKLDVNLRPEEPTDANYDEIPIEHFGLAMLRGMGWNETRGVGRNAKVIAPVEAQIRPKGLGLGADRNSSKKIDISTKQNQDKDASEQIELKKGACCIIISGINKDLYAVVEGVDEDNSRVMVKLALNGKICNLMQCNISLVSKKEYDKFSKYLNKQKADQYKKDEEERLAQTEKYNGHYSDYKHVKSYESKRHKDDNDDYRNENNQRKHKRHKRDDKERDNDISSHNNSSSKHKKKKKHKDEKINKKDQYKHQNSSSDQDESNSKLALAVCKPWVQPELRVRIVDETYKNFYKEKVVIVDVPSPGLCVCKSSHGKVIDGIKQSSLETVIPRDDNSFVLIVTGDYYGNVGQIMKRDKAQCLCLVQLLSDRDKVLKLGYDEVCEYVGNVHAREDY